MIKCSLCKKDGDLLGGMQAALCRATLTCGIDSRTCLVLQMSATRYASHQRNITKDHATLFRTPKGIFSKPKKAVRKSKGTWRTSHPSEKTDLSNKWTALNRSSDGSAIMTSNLTERGSGKDLQQRQLTQIGKIAIPRRVKETVLRFNQTARG